MQEIWRNNDYKHIQSASEEPAAVEEKDCAFLEKQFKKDFVHIREGERAFTECYFAYQALNESKETGAEYTEELIQKYVRLNQVPENIDFRQSEI